MARKPRRGKKAAEAAAPYGARVAEVVIMPYETLEVGERYMKELKEKARLVCEALRKSNIPHAVVGGLAVSAHVCGVDPAAERNTKDLDLLLHSSDLDSAADSLAPLGFRLRKVLGVYAFVKKGGKFRDAIHVVKANEKVRPEYAHAAPAPPESPEFYSSEGYPCLDLALLLTMKLTSFRLKDQVHVQDLLGVGLITRKIEKALPPDLLERLQYVKDQTERERLG
ncbi:MAG: hypothetical protein M5U26_23350 [Planctomycetota bacterium]|nr:hypothetical protein [Planctomycetota bacterium]